MLYYIILIDIILEVSGTDTQTGAVFSPEGCSELADLVLYRIILHYIVV